MISDEEAKETWDKIFNRSECINRLKEITRKNEYNEKISMYLLELLDDVWRSYIFGSFGGCIILSGTILDIALTGELARKGSSKNSLKRSGLDMLITLAKKKGIIRKTAEYLFSIDKEFDEDLNKSIISKNLKYIFKTKGFPLSENATIRNEKDDKWEIHDEKKIYNVKKEDGKLNIYLDTTIANELNNLRNKYAHPSIKGTVKRVKNQTEDWIQVGVLIDEMKSDAKKAIEYIYEILLEIYPKQRHQLKEL